jgi:plastocyanin
MKLVLPQLMFALATATVGHDAPAAITIKTFAFGPKTLEVRTGTTVVWTNADDIEHTVTSGAPDRPDGGFDHPLAAKGATASERFDTAGTWSYFCKRHSFMRGEIRVVPKGEK